MDLCCYFRCMLLAFLWVCSGEGRGYVRVVRGFVWIFGVLSEGCEVSQCEGWPLILNVWSFVVFPLVCSWCGVMFGV